MDVFYNDIMLYAPNAEKDLGIHIIFEKPVEFPHEIHTWWIHIDADIVARCEDQWYW
jgi:hypothetical protein